MKGKGAVIKTSRAMIPLPGATPPEGASDVPDVDTSATGEENFSGAPLDGSTLTETRPSGALLWGLGAVGLLFLLMRKK